MALNVGRRTRRRAPAQLALLAVGGWVAACSPNRAEEEGPDDPPIVVVPDDGLCTGEACGNQNMGDETNVVTEGNGTVVFGNEDVSTAGGIRLSDKIDLLFVVDNSLSMGDKQQIFSLAIPDLLQRLVNPPCLNTELTESVQPATAEEACPVGFGRQFKPVKDIHVGIITSSLGSHGADNPLSGCGEDNSDRAYMMGSLARGQVIPSYRDLGFLAWDPEQRVQPPGSTNLEEITSQFLGMLGSVGENGCAIESQLESMYRFLMDPAPMARHVRVSCGEGDRGQNCARPDGIDEQILAQRGAFLRPDSVVAVIMLTDEDDCSVRDTDIGWFSVDESRGITRASSACDTNPNDACCYSCVADAPQECPPKAEDPACAAGDTVALITPAEEVDRLHPNLRCVDQRRKYGFEYLYPVQRYVLGLTSPWLPEGFDEHGEPLRDEMGEIRFLQNPLFSQPIDEAGNLRSKEQVFFVGIVGVPWQDVATDATRDMPGQLDLIPASEFEATGLWERILGDPAQGIAPTDPFAQESFEPRVGTHPLTGDPVMPIDATVMNPINGKEHVGNDPPDLQFSCILPLPAPRNCVGDAASIGAACDCRENNFAGNPLCWDAATSTYGTQQFFAKAFPAPRILSVLKGVGSQAVVASICPKNITDPAARDFGYRPVIGTFVKEAATVLIK